MSAYATPFAGRWIDVIFPTLFADRVEAAELGTNAMRGAQLRIDHGLMAAPKIVTLSHGGRQNQVQVRGVDIAVCQHGVFCQEREARRDARLAGAPLAADDDNFLHAAASQIVRNKPEKSGL